MKITLHYQTKTTAEGNVCEHTTELLDGKKFPSHTNLVLKKENIYYKTLITFVVKSIITEPISNRSSPSFLYSSAALAALRSTLRSITCLKL